jgi:hypothetical protein
VPSRLGGRVTRRAEVGQEGLKFFVALPDVRGQLLCVSNGLGLLETRQLIDLNGVDATTRASSRCSLTARSADRPSTEAAVFQGPWPSDVGLVVVAGSLLEASAG